MSKTDIASLPIIENFQEITSMEEATTAKIQKHPKPMIGELIRIHMNLHRDGTRGLAKQIGLSHSSIYPPMESSKDALRRNLKRTSAYFVFL